MEKDFLSSVPEGGFPEGKIVLVDGTELTCYPKAEMPREIEGNDMKLDTTGTYLRFKNQPAAMPKEPDALQKTQMNLFKQNAFLFYKNAARIMSDSRMFLVPVDMGNCLAYVGMSGLSNATLGAYLEWWLYSPADVTHDKEGKPALTLSFGGSPLSGMNKCHAVRPDGEVFSYSASSFSTLWRSFRKISCRYTEAKQRCDAYSLREVRDILLQSNMTREEEMKNQMRIMLGKYLNMVEKLKSERKQWDYREAQLHEDINRYCAHLEQCFEQQLGEAKTEYEKRRDCVEQEQKRLEEQRLAYRKKMKQGVITPKQYQQRITPMGKRSKELGLELAMYKADLISRLGKMTGLTGMQIHEYLKNGPLAIPQERPDLDLLVY